MRFSVAWLSDYVDHGLSVDELAELLTMAGLEVDDIERAAGAPAGVVVGCVLEVRSHPSADRLTLCKVDLGPDITPDGPVQIVCGAPNVAVGQKVAVAPVGTVLLLPGRKDPTVRESVTIGRSKIRGEESIGMICSADELGLGDDHSGIMVLDEEAEVGLPLDAYLATRMPSDAVLDVNITPNRPDATSHVGVARDVAALTGRALVIPSVDAPDAGGPAAGLVSISIEDPEGCPAYAGMIVQGVRIGPSPAWLRERLEAVGARSINNVVDVTNYVMREFGQPLHAFDLARLAGPRIVVRVAGVGERLVTLDDVEREIPTGTLLICDAERPVAIAGVMGGSNSEVDESTTDVLIESAYFDPVRVRRAAKALGLATDASYRFERGVDPTGQARAAARAAALIVDVAGGAIVPGLAHEAGRAFEPTVITLRPGRMNRLLGTSIDVDEAVRLLSAIGFTAEQQPARALDAFAGELMRSENLQAAEQAAGEAGLRVTVPPFRPDVTRETDVIEEVARLWGYDRIPTPELDRVPLRPVADLQFDRTARAIGRRLTGLGFREVYCNSLVSDESAERIADASIAGYAVEPVRTLNPISREMSALRPSLVHGLLQATAYNLARGARDLRLFEIGHVYAAGAARESLKQARDGVDGYHEHAALGIAMTGSATPRGWDAGGRAADLMDLKGVVFHAVGNAIGDRIEVVPSSDSGPLLHERLALLVEGRQLGVVGRVSPALADRYDIRGDVFVAELDGDFLAALDENRGPARYVPVSPFPAVERDLAVLIPTGQPVGPLATTIREAGRPMVRDVQVFDVYHDPRLGDGVKSVAFALVLAGDRTLTDEEVDVRVRQIVHALEREHGARLRT